MTPLRHRLAAIAFPPGRRRDELLDTLAEAEEELGARQPRPREAADILWHGTRARLGWAGNPLVVPVALVVMLLGAFTGAVLATQLAWTFVPPLPSGVAAAEIGDTVFPGIRVYGGGDVPDFTTEPDAEAGIVHGYQRYTIDEHTDATRRVAEYATGVHARLAATGWTVHAIDTTETGARQFWAERDGLVLQFEIWYFPGVPWYDSDGSAAYSLSRATPDWMWWAAPAGAPFGALVAFGVFGWVSRRAERAAGLIAIAGLIAVFPLLGVLLLMTEAVRLWWRPEPGTPPIYPFWRPLFYDFTALPTFLLIFLAVTAVLLAACVPPFPLARLRGRIARHRWWRRAAASVQRRWWARLTLAGGVVLLAAGAVMAFTGGPGSCAPDGTPKPLTAAEARASTDARVYVDPASTQDERNLLQAAIGRTGGAAAWLGNQRAAGDSVLTVGCEPESSLWFDVSYTTPGMFDLLVDEVSGLPGVVAVRQV
ncbi:hypothetical protein [Catenuloplanes atrovinosus]|uniref:Uncharacterized protein n=1 Tax=Catenuloplanes atrovinosus TaxID=137266 RepID=A0AAE3YT56_9ACTN|nr:hypothetical protein [Catenuloplanes atrovinosus]MDR7277401.1 hypothetical protein [Catenuloplanes atrovinosus]